MNREKQVIRIEGEPEELLQGMNSLRERSLELIKGSREAEQEIKGRDGNVGNSLQLMKEMEDSLAKSGELIRDLTLENEVLGRIGQTIISSCSAEEIYQNVLDIAKKRLPFDRVTIETFKAEGKSASLVYLGGLPAPGRKVGDGVPVSNVFPTGSINNRTAFLLPLQGEIQQISGLPEGADRFQEGFRSCLRVPLVADGQLIGILSLFSKTPDAYSVGDLPFGERVGLMITEAIGKAKLQECRNRAMMALQTEENSQGLPLEPDTADRIGGILSSTFRISEMYERFAEKKMRESEERYRLLFENIPLGVVSVDLEGNIIEINSILLKMLNEASPEKPSPANIFRYEPLLETGISADLGRCLETGEPGVFECRINGSGEQPRYLRYHVTPLLQDGLTKVGVQAIMEDISEQKRLEGQLLQSQKMEAIGTLAGGIAHDFNNILAAIIGYAELAAWDLPPANRTHKNLTESIKAAQRAKDLVQQILAFSRRNEIEKKPMEVAPILKESLRLLRSSLPATIEIQQIIGNDTGLIQGNPAQIQQVILNLGMNAGQAMEDEGGVLSVRLEEIQGNSGTVDLPHSLPPGPYLLLEVTDTGHGIPREIQNKIFEPYFTTKEVGKGTGLGLAVVHGIVKAHGGAIAVESELGRGTTFRVYFPRISNGTDAEVSLAKLPLPVGRKEKILFVDDEQVLVDAAGQMLKYLGYEVEARVSSQQALEVFKSNPERFDLVITDMTMPTLTGARMAQQMLQLRPDLPIILCTGYNERVTEQQAKEMGIREYLTKPVTIADLARVIRKALEPGKK